MRNPQVIGPGVGSVLGASGLTRPAKKTHCGRFRAMYPSAGSQSLKQS